METTQTNKLWWIGGTAVFLGVVHNLLFWKENFGLNFPLFILIILGAFWFLDTKHLRKIDKTTTLLSVLILFFSGMVFVRSSELLTFFNVVGTGLLFLIVIQLHNGKKLIKYLPIDYLKIATLPAYFLLSFFKKISEFFGAGKIGGHTSKTKEIVRGTLMALVALSIFTWLFSSADIVFGKLVGSIFSFKIDEETIGRLVMFGFIGSLFIGVFGYMFRKIDSNDEGAHNKENRFLGTIETKILLISISVLFFIFIMFQFTYLFGGESQIVSQGITYAEYARKGFFELLLVAFLTSIVILFAESQVVKRGDIHLVFFKVLSSILVAEVLVILISAFARLSLYENAYGFSTIRVYSYALMIWVGVVLIFLSHYIVTNGDRAKFSLRVFASIIFLLFSMNILNPDAFIAKRNMERYRQTGKIDEAYIASLSDDALPYTISLLDEQDEGVRSQFARGVYWAVTRGTDNNPEGLREWKIDTANWKSSHLMDSKIYNLLTPYRKIIEENKRY